MSDRIPAQQTRKPQIHRDLDIISTHIHDSTINDPAAINDSHARGRK